MQSGLGKVPRDLVAAFSFDEVLASHALGGKASLQRPRMYRELVSDGLGAALAGRQ
jgi:hypothetical protein